MNEGVWSVAESIPTEEPVPLCPPQSLGSPAAFHGDKQATNRLNQGPFLYFCHSVSFFLSSLLYSYLPTTTTAITIISTTSNANFYTRGASNADKN
jgi:hypothetical protein